MPRHIGISIIANTHWRGLLEHVIFEEELIRHVILGWTRQLQTSRDLRIWVWVVDKMSGQFLNTIGLALPNDKRLQIKEINRLVLISRYTTHRKEIE